MNTAALKSCTGVIKMFEKSSEELVNWVESYKTVVTHSVFQKMHLKK